MRANVQELRAIRTELTELLDLIGRLDAAAVEQGCDRLSLVPPTVIAVQSLQKVSDLLYAVHGEGNSDDNRTI